MTLVFKQAGQLGGGQGLGMHAGGQLGGQQGLGVQAGGRLGGGQGIGAHFGGNLGKYTGHLGFQFGGKENA